ncbi:MAG: polymorphic toxin-type HINT domain-containing protein [Caldilineaceae bacterium]
MKEIASDAADALDRYVVKPAVQTYERVKEEVGRRYEQAKETVKRKTREFNDRYVKPAREKAANALKSAREGVTKAADWVQAHKDTVAMVAGTVGAIAAGAAFCGLTAGIGCVVIAGVVGGAIAAGGIQMGANVLDSSADTDLFDNVGRAALIGGVSGGLEGLTGGLAGVALKGASALARRGAAALAQRAATAAPRAFTAVRQGAAAVRQGASTVARRAGEGLRNFGRRSCPINSFSAGTLVMTEHGEQPINTIEVGDRVLAYHEVLGETGNYTVTAVISHTDSVIEYLTIDGEQLETTPEHPFFTQERGWVEADELWTGAHVYRADGRLGTVQNAIVARRQQPMYNLTVAQAHTFFVSDGQWLVHNCPPEQFVRYGSQAEANGSKTGGWIGSSPRT